MAAAPQKVLRVPFVIAETSFDPAFASDTYSYTVIDEIFEAVWATGTFEADLMSSELAQVGYRIVDATVKPYEPS